MSGYTVRFVAKEEATVPRYASWKQGWSWHRLSSYWRNQGWPYIGRCDDDRGYEDGWAIWFPKERKKFSWRELVFPTRVEWRNTPVGPHLDIPDPKVDKLGWTFDTSGVTLDAELISHRTLHGAILYHHGTELAMTEFPVPLETIPGDSVGLNSIVMTMNYIR